MRIRTRLKRLRRVRGHDGVLQRGAQAVHSPPSIPARRRTATLDSQRVTVVADSFPLLSRESIATFVPIARTIGPISSTMPRHRLFRRRSSWEGCGIGADGPVEGTRDEPAAEEESPGAEGRGHAPMAKSTIPSK